MLSYYNEIQTSDKLTLSIDNVVLDFYISLPQARDNLMALMGLLPMEKAVNVVHWCSYRPGTFREQFSIQMQDDNSFWLGAVLNGRTPEWGRCRLDFNPNKVANHSVFQKVFRFLIENTRPIHRTIKRFDLAVDIPACRFDCFLIKDSRAYSERRHGQEWTQYLGAKSSTVGRVKLYNKQVESKLNKPLTRLEITLDPALPYNAVQWPIVYVLDKPQLCLEEMKVTDTQRFILNAILQGCGSLNDLGRKTKDSIETLMQLYVKTVKVKPQDYSTILKQLNEYVKGTVQFEMSDPDQPPPPPPKYPAWALYAENDTDPVEPLKTRQSDFVMQKGG